jgi:hypothetical protein
MAGTLKTPTQGQHVGTVARHTTLT